MKRPVRAGVAAAALMAVGLAMSACSAEVNVGSDPSLKAGEIVDTITAQYEQQNPGITLTEMTCQGAEASVGTPIRCEGANSRGVELTFGGEITSIDEENKRANYRWEVTRALAPGAIFESEITALGGREGRPVVTAVSCPERVQITVGRRFRCEITTAAGTEPVTVTLTDTKGGFRIGPA